MSRLVNTKKIPSADLRILEKYLGCHPKYLIMTNGEIRADAAQIEADGTKVYDLEKWGVKGCRPDISIDGKTLAWGETDWEMCVADVNLRKCASDELAYLSGRKAEAGHIINPAIEGFRGRLRQLLHRCNSIRHNHEWYHGIRSYEAIVLLVLCCRM